MASLAQFDPADLPSRRDLTPYRWPVVLLWTALTIGVVRYLTWADLVFILPAYYFALGLHEAGHMAAAIALGYKVVGIGVRPWGFMREGRGWRFRRSNRSVGGFVIAYPTRPDHARLRHAAVVAAGPAVTAMRLVGAVIAAQHTDGVLRSLSSELAFFAGLHTV